MRTFPRFLGRVWFVWLLGELAVLSASDAPVRTPLTPAFLNRLTEEARTNNPALRAAETKTRAARLNVQSIRLWEDPMLTLGGVAASDRGPDLAMEGDLVYGFDQKLPLFGKASSQKRVAVAEVSAARASAELAFQLLRRELSQGVLGLTLSDEVVAIGEQDLSWLDIIVSSAEKRYQATDTTQAEVLRLQNERALRQDQLRADRNERIRQQAVVNRLLNRSADSAWPLLDLPVVAKAVVMSERLMDLTLRYEPQLRVMNQDLEVMTNRVEFARRQKRPDISLGMEARHYSEDGGFREGMFLMRINLPWFNLAKYRRDLEKEQAQLDARKWEAIDYQLAVREEVTRLVTRIEDARRQALLYKDEIIPRATQTLAVTESSWSTGRSSFIDLLEARRFLLESRLVYAKAVKEQYERLTDLTLCCGLADLDALDMVSP